MEDLDKGIKRPVRWKMWGMWGGSSTLLAVMGFLATYVWDDFKGSIDNINTDTSSIEKKIDEMDVKHTKEMNKLEEEVKSLKGDIKERDDFIWYTLKDHRDEIKHLEVDSGIVKELVKNYRMQMIMERRYDSVEYQKKEIIKEVKKPEFNTDDIEKLMLEQKILKEETKRGHDEYKRQQQQKR